MRHLQVALCVATLVGCAGETRIETRYDVFIDDAAVRLGEAFSRSQENVILAQPAQVSWEGQVLLSDGVTPASDVTVYAHDVRTKRWIAEADIDSTGRFAMKVTPGTFELVLHNFYGGDNPLAPPLQIVTAPTEITTAGRFGDVAIIRSGVVRGTVRQGGVPVKGLVLAESPYGFVGRSLTSTDDFGAYEIVLSEGTHQLFAKVGALPYQPVAVVDVKNGAVTPHDVDVVVGGLASGVVTDTAGKPLQGIMVWAWRVMEDLGVDVSVDATLTDEHGAWSLALGPGPHRIDYRSDEEMKFAAATSAVEMPPAGTVELEMSLQKLVIVTGELQGVGEGVEITLFDTDAMLDPPATMAHYNGDVVTTGPGGSFTALLGPSRRFEIIANAPTQNVGTLETGSSDMDGVVLTLDDPGIVFQGTVHTISGAASANVAVSVAHSQVRMLQIAETVTSEQGHFDMVLPSAPVLLPDGLAAYWDWYSRTYDPLY